MIHNSQSVTPSQKVYMLISYKSCSNVVALASVKRKARALDPTEESEALSVFINSVRDFPSIFEANAPAEYIIEIIGGICNVPVNQLLSYDIWSSVIHSSFFDFLTFSEFTECNAMVLWQLFEPLCTIFRLGDLDNAGGTLLQQLPMTEFLASLRLFSGYFTSSPEFNLPYYRLLSNIARLRNSAIGETFDCVLAFSMSVDDWGTIYSDFLQLTIDEIENFHFQTRDILMPITPDFPFSNEGMTPPASPVFLCGFVGIALDPQSHNPQISSDLSELLLSALELLCRHYPNYCNAIYECDLPELVKVLETKENSAILVRHLLCSMREMAYVAFTEKIEISWDIEYLVQFRRIVGADSLEYIFVIFRHMIGNVPHCASQLMNFDFVSWIVQELIEGEASFQAQTKGAMLLLVFVRDLLDGQDSDMLREYFFLIQNVLLRCLDWPDKWLTIAIEIFDWFDVRDVLTPSVSPVCFEWLADWQSESQLTTETDILIQELQIHHKLGDVSENSGN
jgi:hypothetical protein